MPNISIAVSGIWLRSEGKEVVVLFERDGKWYEGIRESTEPSNTISHIIEGHGMFGAKLDRLEAK
jgi:hypothetical protein